MKVENHKYVDNYWVEEYPSGVIHLLINLTQREIYFHAYNDYEFIICGTPQEYEEFAAEFILRTKDFLLSNDFMYIQAEHKNKDQLSFYYIPWPKNWNNRKYIIE